MTIRTPDEVRTELLERIHATGDGMLKGVQMPGLSPEAQQGLAALWHRLVDGRIADEVDDFVSTYDVVVSDQLRRQALRTRAFDAITHGSPDALDQLDTWLWALEQRRPSSVSEDHAGQGKPVMNPTVTE